MNIDGHFLIADHDTSRCCSWDTPDFEFVAPNLLIDCLTFTIVSVKQLLRGSLSVNLSLPPLIYSLVKAVYDLDQYKHALKYRLGRTAAFKL